MLYLSPLPDATIYSMIHGLETDKERLIPDWNTYIYCFHTLLASILLQHVGIFQISYLFSGKSGRFFFWSDLLIRSECTKSLTDGGGEKSTHFNVYQNWCYILKHACGRLPKTPAPMFPHLQIGFLRCVKNWGSWYHYQLWTFFHRHMILPIDLKTLQISKGTII